MGRIVLPHRVIIVWLQWESHFLEHSLLYNYHLEASVHSPCVTALTVACGFAHSLMKPLWELVVHLLILFLFWSPPSLFYLLSGQTHHGACVEVRTCESVVFSTVRVLGIELRSKDWQQSPLPTNPSHSPYISLKSLPVNSSICLDGWCFMIAVNF